MAVIYSKWPKNIPNFSIPRPSKIYPNWDFWFESKPSGNPAFSGMSDRRCLHSLIWPQSMTVGFNFV
jgi:hypothetical protein